MPRNLIITEEEWRGYQQQLISYKRHLTQLREELVQIKEERLELQVTLLNTELKLKSVNRTAKQRQAALEEEVARLQKENHQLRMDRVSAAVAEAQFRRRNNIEQSPMQTAGLFGGGGRVTPVTHSNVIAPLRKKVHFNEAVRCQTPI